jgi:hypothetical protein
MSIRHIAAITGLLSMLLLASCGGDKVVIPQVDISEKDGYRYIRTNGIPNHSTGDFPNDACPFSIGENEKTYKVTLRPSPSDEQTAAGDFMFGIAINGVMMDPAGPFLNKDASTGWEFHPASPNLQKYFGVDFNNAHTQPLGPFTSKGLYHYHGLPTSLIDSLSEIGKAKMILLGYAADGYPIYNNYGLIAANDLQSGFKKVKSSYVLKSGSRKKGEPKGQYDGTFVQDYEYIEGIGDLDEYNGRLGKTPEYPSGIYHYYITDEFPNMPLMFRGTPDLSFKHEGPGNAMAEVPHAIRNWEMQE